MKMNIYKYEVTREYVGDGEEMYQVNKSDAVTKFLKDRKVHMLPEEHFYVILLDTRNHIVGYHEVTKGLLDRSHVHPREVFRVAIIENASKVILCHNHPSGDPSPSKQDIESTTNLVEAGGILGIKVLDHIIVTERLGLFKSASMADMGLF